ncbi:MAG: hypothetical protein M1546_17500, partial [Chloroflexi bacterium]|nr:hypothetical protein [Chloroflexota bacterium]
SDEDKDAEQQFSEMKDKLMSQLKRLFRPEFLNRVDATIVFHPLTRDDIGQIVSLELNKVQKRLSDHNIKIEVTEPAKNYLAEKGFDPDYGARPLRRVIQNEVEDVLSDGLLSGKFLDNSKILIGLADNKLDFVMVEEVAGSAENVEIKPVDQGDNQKPEGSLFESLLEN